MNNRFSDPIRRDVLRIAFAAAVCPLAARRAGAQSISLDGPRAGDVVVFTEGSKASAVIQPSDIRAEGPPVLAWPMEPATRHVRNGSRTNLLLLLRSDTAVSSGSSDILAFSALCTHASCTVSGWKAEGKLLLCPCHGSLYDPKEGAKVVYGPAPRPLPRLPLTLARGVLTITGPFTGPIGGTSSRTE